MTISTWLRVHYIGGADVGSSAEVRSLQDARPHNGSPPNDLPRQKPITSQNSCREPVAFAPLSEEAEWLGVYELGALLLSSVTSKGQVSSSASLFHSVKWEEKLNLLYEDVGRNTGAVVCKTFSTKFSPEGILAVCARG